MQKNIIKSLDKIIILLLFTLGVFSGCKTEQNVTGKNGNKQEEEIEKPCMYGPPPARIKKSATEIQETTNFMQDFLENSEIDLQD